MGITLTYDRSEKAEDEMEGDREAGNGRFCFDCFSLVVQNELGYRGRGLLPALIGDQHFCANANANIGRSRNSGVQGLSAHVH